MAFLKALSKDLKDLERRSDFTHLFDNSDYSDVKIRFSGRELNCHKLILCMNSSYFNNLCGPKSRFAEANQEAIELHGDDPAALEAMLRFVYSGKYPTTRKRKRVWLYHLEICKTADKYMFEWLEAEARGRVKLSVDALTEPLEIWEAITNIREMSQHDELLNLAKELERTHLSQLLRDPAVRRQVDVDKDLMWKYLDQLTEAITEPPEEDDDMVQVEVWWCHSCVKRGIAFSDGKGRHVVNVLCRNEVPTSFPAFFQRAHLDAVRRGWPQFYL